MPFEPAIEAAAVPPGQCRSARVAGRWVAVCNDAGRFFACDNECPHAGGPLGRGEVADGKVVCPVHHWPWDLQTGKTADEWEHMRVRCYAIDVREGVVHVDTERTINSLGTLD